MIGSYIPLAATSAEREKSHDPRPSVMERYGSRADYLRRVQEAAHQLVQARYLLPDDVSPIVEHAGQHWDYLMTGGKAKEVSK